MAPDHRRRRSAVAAAIPELVDQPADAFVACERRHITEAVQRSFAGQRKHNRDRHEGGRASSNELALARAETAGAANCCDTDWDERDETTQERGPRPRHPQASPAE